ncbi:MAG: ABC transporter ATP-binding protein [Frankia sp.]
MAARGGLGDGEPPATGSARVAGLVGAPDPAGGASVPSPPAVNVRDLVKRYPKRPVNAVDGVSFSVGGGEVFGLLGPNGAGKTTTIGILTTRVAPSGGRAEIAGVDVVADPVGARRHLAVVPQRANLDQALSARRNLLFHAAYFGMGAAERSARADELLAQFGLSDRGDDKVDRFSGGQVQRLLIARALMHSPRVLFLDEPSAGLDPQARLFIWDRIRDLRSAGVTVFLTTHDMDEAAALADRVGVMDRGRLLALDTPAALVERIGGASTLDVGIGLGASGDLPALLGGLAALPGVDHLDRVSPDGPGGPDPGRAPPRGPGRAPARAPTSVRVRIYGTGDATALLVPVAQVLEKHGATPRDLTLGRPTLEDVFISLTGRGLRG